MGWFDFIGDVVDWVGDVVDGAIEWIGDALTPDIDLPDTPTLNAQNRGILLNSAGSVKRIPVVYGRRKVGGKIFRKTTGGGASNPNLYIPLAVSEGEIGGFVSQFIDDLPFDDARFAGGLVTLGLHTGADNQAADATFLADGVGWTVTDTASGIAYIAAKFVNNTVAFRGEPVINSIIDGVKVLDTRTSTTATSGNPAIVLYDYLTNPRYGKGLAAALLDTASFEAGADFYDTLVTPYTGAPQQKILTCNAVLDTGATILSNVRILLAGMLGNLPFYDGQYHLHVDGPGTSVFSFDESNILTGFSTSGATKSAQKNRVVVSFPNPDKNWELDETSYPVKDSAEHLALLAEDNGFENVLKISLPTITDVYMARYLGKVFLYKSRFSRKLSFKTTLAAMALTYGDIVDVTLSSPGWAGKLFKVVGLTYNADATIGVSLVVHDDAIYPWSLSDFADIPPQTNLLDPTVVQPPGIPSATESIYQTTGSAGVKAKALVSWAASDDVMVVNYQFEYKVVGAPDWIILPPQAGLSVEILDIAPGNFTWRVKGINNIGAASTYATNVAQEITALSAPPSALTGLTISTIGGTAYLAWNLTTDLDVRLGGQVLFRHSPALVGASWGASTGIGNPPAGSATQTVLPLKSGTYLARFFDSTGNAGPVSTVITTAATAIAWADVASISAHPSFPGVHADTVAMDGVLTLSGATLIDDWGLIDSIAMMDTVGGIATTGVYDFASGLDFGVVKRVRLTTVIDALVVNKDDKIDSRTTLIDSWSSIDGGEIISGVDARIWVRTTNDDPAASPIWSAWQLLDVAEYQCRAADFQCRLQSNDPVYAINISTLTINAQEVI